MWVKKKTQNWIIRKKMLALHMVLKPCARHSKQLIILLATIEKIIIPCIENCVQKTIGHRYSLHANNDNIVV